MAYYSKAFEKILDIYTESNIKSFPIDCFDILKQCNVKFYSYHTISIEKPKLHQLLKQYSADALRIGDIIYYDNKKSATRMRFSLMHELGHIVLNHGKNPTQNMEAEANYFASNILAPRMIIYYARCKNHADVCKIFGLSEEASLYAFNSYKRWYRNAVHRGYSKNDNTMYHHFFDPTLDKMVYKIKYCKLCTEEIYNTDDQFCPACQSSFERKTKTYSKPDKDLLKAEASRLYNES